MITETFIGCSLMLTGKRIEFSQKRIKVRRKAKSREQRAEGKEQVDSTYYEPRYIHFRPVWTNI